MIESHSFGDISLFIAPILRRDGDSRSEAEHRTVAGLVKFALGPLAEIGHRPSGAPYIIGDDISFSVSHSRSHAAIALSRSSVVGVDIEEQRQQLARVAPRVLSDDELLEYSTPRLLLQAWTLKEALYKAALTPGLDFRKDIGLPLPVGSHMATVECRRYKVISILTTPVYTLALVSSEN